MVAELLATPICFIKMNFLPVFLNIKDQCCLVIGGGLVAERKIEYLLKAGAEVRVVTRRSIGSIQKMHESEQLRLVLRSFQESDLDGIYLAIAATDDKALNTRISTLAQSKNIPVNVVDNPDLCSFITPSVIDRDPLQIAISTGGASPVLARQVRAQLESAIPAAYGELAQLVERYRSGVKTTFPRMDERRRFWELILEGPVAELAFSGQLREANALLEQLIADAKPEPIYQGEVYLVGAGPGDPDLLTFKALRLMQKCDVVVYDRLVSSAILDLVRRDAERIYADKDGANHSLPQEGINQLLVRLAREGQCVLRLKGGDPFGRGSDEIRDLVDEQINFQVVPGITAAAISP